MGATTLREAIQPYREPTTKGISIYLNPNDHSVDNSLLFSSEYILALPIADRMEEYRWYKWFVQSCMKQPGLLVRYPNDQGDEQHDDITGVVTASWFLGLNFPQQILAWGRAHRNCWNAEHPDTYDLKYDFGRYPGFIAFLKVASKEELNIIDQISFFISCLGILIEKPDDTTGKILQYLKNKVVFGKYWLCDLGIKLWRNRASSIYPGGIKQVYARYFGSSHPLALFSPDNFI